MLKILIIIAEMPSTSRTSKVVPICIPKSPFLLLSSTLGIYYLYFFFNQIGKMTSCYLICSSLFSSTFSFPLSYTSTSYSLLFLSPILPALLSFSSSLFFSFSSPLFPCLLLPLHTFFPLSSPHGLIPLLPPLLLLLLLPPPLGTIVPGGRGTQRCY